MMNSKLVKILAMVMVLVCAAMMMASCVAGGTKEDQKGDEDVIGSLVPEKQDVEKIEYTGDPIEVEE